MQEAEDRPVIPSAYPALDLPHLGQWCEWNLATSSGLISEPVNTDDPVDNSCPAFCIVESHPYLLQRGKKWKDLMKTNCITPDKLERLFSALNDLPEKPKEKLSLREAVMELAEAIRGAINKGYSLTDIAELFAQMNINVRPATISGYLKELTPKAGKKRSRNKTSPVGEPPALMSTAHTQEEEAWALGLDESSIHEPATFPYSRT